MAHDGVRVLGGVGLGVVAGVLAALFWWPSDGGEQLPDAPREMVGPGYMPDSAPLTAPAAPPPRAGARRIEYDLLSYYDYDPEADVIPDDVLELDGRTIEVIGVMYYGVEDPDRVTEFYLMPNHMVCCYGTFRLNEAVEVLLRPGTVTRYVLNYYLIRGKIEVGAIRDEQDQVVCLYRITDAVAEVLE